MEYTTEGMWLHKLSVWSLPQAQQLYSIKKMLPVRAFLGSYQAQDKYKEMLCTMRDVKCGLISN
jgi:hypothetical protein